MLFLIQYVRPVGHIHDSYPFPYEVFRSDPKVGESEPSV
jgi:hypothetical protein